jgi:uncharacterized integral membrane protein
MTPVILDFIHWSLGWVLIILALIALILTCLIIAIQAGIADRKRRTIK